MNDEPNGQRGKGDGSDRPLTELADLRVEPSPDLSGRVHRDINRRTLVADSLDFSLNVMLQTFWDHLRSAIDAWPAAAREPDPDSPRPDDQKRDD